MKFTRCRLRLISSPGRSNICGSLCLAVHAPAALCSQTDCWEIEAWQTSVSATSSIKILKELSLNQEERGRLSNARQFFFSIMFFSPKCALQQSCELTESQHIEEYSVSLEHVSLWNSIIVFAESQIVHLPVGTEVIYLHVSESPLLDMSTASVSSVMQPY